MKSDYYVYLHKTLDGKVFYAGKGRDKRAWVKTNRSKRWKEVSDAGYTVEIYEDSLSEKDALLKEAELIRSMDNLVNTCVFTPVAFDDYSEYFAYDENSPSGLTRIKGVFNGLYEKGVIGFCGHKTTRSSGAKLWKIKHKNKSVVVHRIIWELLKCKIPENMVIDHIDGNSLNNNISNLRLVSQGINTKNRRISKNNNTGLCGITFPDNSVRATLRNDGITVSKRFSLSKYGKEEAVRLACEYRAEQIRLLNEQGAGYTERHGT